MKKSTKFIMTILITLCCSLFVNNALLINVSAMENDDVLYLNTFNSVMDAKKHNTQQSINIARKFIGNMRLRPSLQFAVGEFSKQVDGVQQKLFVDFYALMYENGEEKSTMSQSDINAAREYIKDFSTFSGNLPYVATWSSKIDFFQGKNIIEAQRAVELATNTKNIKDIEKAKKLVEKLSLSTNRDTFNESQRLKNLLENMASKTSTENSDGIITTKEQFRVAIKNALGNFETSLNLKVKNYNTAYDLNEVEKVILEHPEIDYGYESVYGSISSGGRDGVQQLNLTMKYRLSRNTMISQKQSVQAKVNEVVNKVIKPNMSLVEKEVVLHDYLVKNAEYNIESINRGIIIPEDHNAYGVLVKGIGVCESYAKAMYELCTAAGIECRYVIGNVSEGPHAWNMVKLDDGKWYNVDVTWDDPVYENGANKGLLNVHYNYFNVPDRIMNKTHIRDNKIQYPVADGEKYVFKNLDILEYDKDGNLFENVRTVDELHKKIAYAIINNKDILNLKVYNLNMDMNQLLNEVSNAIKKYNIKIYPGYGITCSGEDIKYVRYSFRY